MNSAAEREHDLPPAPDAEVGVGERLRQGRRAAGLSLEDVALQLKFNPRQIDALENERYAELPEGIFARGMVRSYARLVRLDPEPLVQRVAGALAPPPVIDDAISFRKPIPFSDSTRRARLAYAILSLAVLGVVTALLVDWPRERSAGAELAFVAPAHAPEAAAPGDETTPLDATRPAAPAAIGVPLAVAAPQPEPAASPLAVAPEAAPEAAAAADAGETRRIVLRFDQAAWVEVHGGDDRILVSHLHDAGTSRVIEGAPPFRLVIGNARHVRLRYGEDAIDLAPYTKGDVARLTLE
jgi:cytoskeleton protein RodZ